MVMSSKVRWPGELSYHDRIKGIREPACWRESHKLVFST